MNREVSLWKKALASQEMADFVEMLQDTETLAEVTGFVERLKKALTAERIHRLHDLFEKEGVFNLGDDDYQAFGGVIGTKVKDQLTTAEGIKELQGHLDTIEKLLRSKALGDVGRVMKMRAPILTPHIAEDVHTSFQQSAAVADIAPQVAETLQAIIKITHPLLDFNTRADRVLSWAFWADVNRVMDAILSGLANSLLAAQKLLVTLSRILEQDRVGGLRLLIADVSGSLAAPRVFGSMHLNVPGNVSAMVMGTGLGMLGMVDTTPVLTPDVLANVLEALDTLDAVLVPGEVEKTRETVQIITNVSCLLHLDMMDG
jgi:hypothetical protein